MSIHFESQSGNTRLSHSLSHSDTDFCVYSDGPHFAAIRPKTRGSEVKEREHNPSSTQGESNRTCQRLLNCTLLKFSEFFKWLFQKVSPWYYFIETTKAHQSCFFATVPRKNYLVWANFYDHKTTAVSRRQETVQNQCRLCDCALLQVSIDSEIIG